MKTLITSLLIFQVILLPSQASVEPNYFLLGRDNLPTPGEMVTGTFMFYNNENGALRGGFLANSLNWSPDSLGSFSMAWGIDSRASGDEGATALGTRSTASGDFGATALGRRTIASGGEGATALGNETTANGDFGATALGNSTEASGDEGATALGNGTTASGSQGATALGYSTTASGSFGATALGSATTARGFLGATALGNSTTASGGQGATALGNETIASGGQGATALGSRTIATGNSCTVVGLFNDTIVAAGTNISPTSPIFIIGNGDFGNGNESNAMVVRKDGSVGLGTDASRGQLSIKQRTNGDNEGLRLIGHNSDIAWEIRHTGSGDNLRFRAFDEDNNTDHTVEIRRSDGAYLMNSDRRLKKNIEYMDHMLPLITAIQPTQYHWIKDKNEEKTPSLGVIAQDLELLFPQAVHTNEDGFKMVNYDALGVLAIQAVKEQQDLISEMKDQINEMKELIQGHTILIQKLTSGDDSSN